ncbi:MAG: AI-2E family transporter [Firmicutes bacterium]|nr:AI-2E family transporter [Bacillota bacterium]
MDKRLKDCFKVVAFGVILFAALNHIDVIASAALGIIKILQPILVGAVIAFIMNVPVTKFSALFGKLAAKMNKKPKQSVLTVLSVAATVICILAVIALVAVVLIPQLIDSVSTAVAAVREQMPQWIEFLNEKGIDSEWITDALKRIQNLNVADILKNSFTGITSTLTSTISSTVSITKNTVLSIVIAFYMLLCKDMLRTQINKLADAYVPEKISRPIYKVARLTNSTYSDFFCGQCVEAVILGVLMFLAFTIFRLPYAGLVGVLTAVMSFIPYVGSFLACGIVAVLICISSPVKALISIAVYLAVQFCENQFIYPRVVGRSVGLPPMWTLIAVLVGGSLLGIVGMIFFIPIFAVIYKLISENASARIAKKRATGGRDDE